MQDLLVDWFGSTGATAIRYIIAFVVVAGLLLLLRWVMQTYVGRGGFGVARGRQNRIAVVDAVAVDPRRRLLLVRRDNVEHLILVGGGNDLVVEPTIIRGVPVGSLGRVGRGPAAAASERVEFPAMNEAHPTPAEAPHPAEPQVAASEPLAEPAPVVSSRVERPAPRVVERPAPAEPAASRFRPIERVRPRAAEAPSAPAASPYAPSAAPIATETPASEPASSREFDDLARQLDEALKSDLAANPPPIEPAPAVEPPVAAAPVPPVEPPRPANRPIMPAASTWLRPRAGAAKTAAPAAKAAPEPAPAPAQAPEPAPRPQAAPRVSVRPTAAPVAAAPVPPVEPPIREERSLDDRLSETLTQATPSAEAAAPETKPPVETPPERVSSAKGGDHDFTSLEDEMARLLDELAGDSKGKR
jgi:hypothetical protein